jgi:hypothetical protein
MSKETIEVLENSGLGNHPNIVADFIKLGKSISEGRFVEGKGTPPGASAQTLFPSMQNP